MAEWEVEPDVDIQVIIFGAGPFDEPFAPPVVDVTRYIRGGGISIKRGRSDEFTSFQSGSCSFTLKNDNREFDPSNMASPYIDILMPLRRVQVLATYQGTVRSLFVGYIDGWPRGWTKTTGSVEIVAHDAFTVMARAMTMLVPVGGLIIGHPDDGRLDHGRLSGDMPEQQSGERVRALLQLAGFSQGATLVIDTGLTTVVEQEPTGSVLQLVQEAEFAEAGFLFVDRDGIIRFLDRHSRFQETRIGNVQAVFTDSQYADLMVDQNLTQVHNHVGFSRPGGIEQIAMNDESMMDFGPIHFHKEIPAVSDGETQARAEFWVDRYGMPQDRPAPIVVNPRKNMAVLFPAVVDRELLDRIQIQRTPLGVAPTVTYTGLVESIEHRITNESWTTTLAMSPIDVSEGDDFMVLNDATLGQINTHTLAY